MTLQLLDELAMSPPGALRQRLADVARVADDGIGAVVEYELYRRTSRPDLPPLAGHVTSPTVELVADLLGEPQRSPKVLHMAAVGCDAVWIPPELGALTAWIAFLQRAKATAQAVGFGNSVAAGLAGAIAELADNVIQHSEAPLTGVAAFARTARRFEYVVGDAGIGVLASLRQASEFQLLRDDVEALPLAVRPGISRHGRDGTRGYGYRQVFKPLGAVSGRVRLRSGAAVLTLEGIGPSPDRGVCSQRPVHKGLTVSAVLFHT